MQLTVNIHFEEGSYWANVREFPGCFAAGDSLEELFASVGEGLELYLEDEEALELPLAEPASSES